MKKNLLCGCLALLLLLSVFGCKKDKPTEPADTPKPAASETAAPTEEPKADVPELPELQEFADTYEDHLPENAEDGLTLHAFNWTYHEIMINLENIRNAGFKNVLTMPVQQPKGGGYLLRREGTGKTDGSTCTHHSQRRQDQRSEQEINRALLFIRFARKEDLPQPGKQPSQEVLLFQVLLSLPKDIRFDYIMLMHQKHVKNTIRQQDEYNSRSPIVFFAVQTRLFRAIIAPVCLRAEHSPPSVRRLFFFLCFPGGQINV